LNFYGIKKNKIYDNIILSRKTNKIIKLKFKDVQMQLANQFLKRKNHKKFNLVTIDEAIKTMEIIDKLK
jgi:hypothetical protein